MSRAVQEAVVRYARREVSASPARHGDIGAWSSPEVLARTENCANGWLPSRSRAEPSCIFRGRICTDKRRDDCPCGCLRMARPAAAGGGPQHLP